MSLLPGSSALGPRRRRRLRRARRLAAVESLERRMVPSDLVSSVISGHVFLAVNPSLAASASFVTGASSPAQPAVAGTPVGLFDASNQLVATTLTSSDGFYAFSVSNPTETLMQTLTLGPTLTNYEEPLSPGLSLFDPTRSQLLSVTVSVQSDLVSQIVVDNTGGETSQITSTLSGAVNLVGLVPGGVAKLEGASPTAAPVELPENQQTTLTLEAPSVQTYVFDQPTDLAFYTATVGGSTVSPVIGTTALLQLSTSPNGNLTTDATTSGSATVVVSYSYVPSQGNFTVRLLAQPAGTVPGPSLLDGQPVPTSNGPTGVAVVPNGGDSVTVDFTVVPVPTPPVTSPATPGLTAAPSGASVSTAPGGSPRTASRRPVASGHVNRITRPAVATRTVASDSAEGSSQDFGASHPGGPVFRIGRRR